MWVVRKCKGCLASPPKRQWNNGAGFTKSRRIMEETNGTNASIKSIWGIFARLKRRDLLNTTASTRIGWVLVAIIYSAGTAWAAPPQGNGDTPSASAGSGQAASPRTDDKGQQAADLLRRARQAMAENDLAAAESLIAQSEALGVEYNSFHLGDTPKKARRDLDRKRSASGPAKPSQLFSPLAGNKKNVPASDPFAGRLNETPSPSTDIRQVLPLPRVENGAPAELPAVLKNASPQAMAVRNYPSTAPNENDLSLPPFLAKGSAAARWSQRQ